MELELTLRRLSDDDAASIARAFDAVGWTKPGDQFERYFREQLADERLCLVAHVGDQVSGYVTVVWRPPADPSIPAIVDLNVLPEFRNRGIGSRLLDRAEAEVSRRSPVVAIGVGLHEGYGAAQRLYAKRGYVPDGRGVTYRDRRVEPGQQVAVDDDLTLNLTKRLGAATATGSNRRVSQSLDAKSGVHVTEIDLRRPDHAEAVLTLVDAYAADPMGQAAPLSKDARSRLIPALRRHPTTLVFVAWQGGSGIGIAVCFLGVSTFEARTLVNIADFYVVPERRGLGVGHQLLDGVERRARELGCCRLTLEVQENNHRARSVYGAAGFAQAVYHEDAGGSLYFVKTLSATGMRR